MSSHYCFGKHVHYRMINVSCQFLLKTVTSADSIYFEMSKMLILFSLSMGGVTLDLLYTCGYQQNMSEPTAFQIFQHDLCFRVFTLIYFRINEFLSRYFFFKFQFLSMTCVSGSLFVICFTINTFVFAFLFVFVLILLIKHV